MKQIFFLLLFPLAAFAEGDVSVNDCLKLCGTNGVKTYKPKAGGEPAACECNAPAAAPATPAPGRNCTIEQPAKNAAARAMLGGWWPKKYKQVCK